MDDFVYFPGLAPIGFSAIADFLTESEFAHNRLRTADDVLGYSLIDAYEKADVTHGEVYEVGFLALSLALADWAGANLDLKPVACGGQSFGAIAGAVFGGTLDYRDALGLVRKSSLVQVDYFDGLAEPMSSFVFYRLDSDTVDSLVERCRRNGHRVEVSMYLDNLVHSVSGTVSGIDAARSEVQAEGGYVFHQTDRADHCSLIADLRTRLEREVYRHIPWRRGGLPMLSDVSGRILTQPESVMADLLESWTTALRWSTTLEGLRASGAERVFVVGPQNMSGLLRNIIVPTTVISPKVVREFPRSGLPPPTSQSSGA